MIYDYINEKDIFEGMGYREISQLSILLEAYANCKIINFPNDYLRPLKGRIINFIIDENYNILLVDDQGDLIGLNKDNNAEVLIECKECGHKMIYTDLNNKNKCDYCDTIIEDEEEEI